MEAGKEHAKEVGLVTLGEIIVICASLTRARRADSAGLLRRDVFPGRDFGAIIGLEVKIPKVNRLFYKL